VTDWIDANWFSLLKAVRVCVPRPVTGTADPFVLFPAL
jgi:hypothetical protein